MNDSALDTTPSATFAARRTFRAGSREGRLVVLGGRSRSRSVDTLIHSEAKGELRAVGATRGSVDADPGADLWTRAYWVRGGVSSTQERYHDRGWTDARYWRQVVGYPAVGRSVSGRATRSARGVHDRRLPIMLLVALVGVVLIGLMASRTIGASTTVVVLAVVLGGFIVVLDIARAIVNYG
jgi:hypothetical protein